MPAPHLKIPPMSSYVIGIVSQLKGYDLFHSAITHDKTLTMYNWNKRRSMRLAILHSLAIYVCIMDGGVPSQQMCTFDYWISYADFDLEIVLSKLACRI